MKLHFKPVPVLKTFAATLSLWTMCFAPVAQGAEAENNNKELINRYLKETGLTTQKMTVGQFWAKVRHVYPTVLQVQLDPWMQLHKDEPMPHVDATSFKDADNKEQVRVMLSKGSETYSLTFTGDEDKPLKVNNVVLTKQEVFNYKKFDRLSEKIYNEDPAYAKDRKTTTKLENNKKTNQVASSKKAQQTVAGKKEVQARWPAKVAKNQEKNLQEKGKVKRSLAGRELAKLSLRQQMDYLLKMRKASEAADRVLESQRQPSGSGKKGTSFWFDQNDSAVVSIWRVLLGAEVIAAGKDTSCIASGWVAVYYKGSCAKPTIGQQALLSQIEGLRAGTFPSAVVDRVASCASSGGLPCNPLLYGFQPGSSGEPICITNDLPSATKQCSAAVPLPSKKEQIIQSIVKARGGEEGICHIVEKDGTSLVSQTCADKLDKYTKELEDHYLNAARFCTKGGVSSVDSAKEWDAKARKDILKDQIQACENLKDRFFDLKVEASPIVDPCEGIPGSHAGADGKCVCSDGQPPHPAKSGGAPAPAGPGSGSGLPPGKGPPGSISDLPEPDKPAGPAPTPAGGASAGLTCEAVPDVPGSGNGDLPPQNQPKKDECQESFWCRNKNWLIPVGVGLVAFGLIWWIANSGKKKNKKPTYTPPAPPPLPTPTPSPNPTPVTPIPSNPACPAPNVIINGVCTSPVIVPPPEIPPDEGGSGNGPSGAGGIR